MSIFGLCALGIAQPLFDVLSKGPTFFIANRLKPVDIISLVLLLVVILPLIMVLITGILSRVNARVGEGARMSWVALLASVIALQFIKRIAQLPDFVLILFSIALGVTVVLLSLRLKAVRQFLTALSVAVPVIVCVFLFLSPVRKLLFPSEAQSVQGEKIDATAPVIMLVFDELSSVSLMNDKHDIDSLRYPGLAAFAHDAYWFRNATASADNTERAVPAILTGIFPDTTSTPLPTLGDHPNNLFTLFGRSYDMQVTESVSSLCPPELAGTTQLKRTYPERMIAMGSDLSVIYLHILLPDELRRGLPPVDKNWGGFLQHPLHSPQSIGGQSSALQVAGPDSQQTGNNFYVKDRRVQFRRFISSIRSPDDRALYFMHILLPHFPWEYLPSGRRYIINSSRIPGLTEERWGSRDLLVVRAYRRYLLQLGFVDKMVGDLMAHLKEIDLYDKAAIILCADHGVSFRPNDYRRPLSDSNYVDILPIPFLIKGPYQRHRVVSDRNVEAIDILPTLSGMLHIQIPWKVDGLSGLDTAIAERKEKLVYGGTDLKKTIHRYPGEFSEKYKSVSRQIQLFGSGSAPEDLFASGVFPELIGRSVSEMRVRSHGNFKYWLTNREAYSFVRLSSDYIPASVAGRIDKEPRSKQHFVAIGVNGIIRSVTGTFEDSTGDFSELVPENCLIEGRNNVEIFVVEGDAKNPALLRPNGVLAYRLFASPKSGSEVLLSPDGRTIPIVQNAIQGRIDSIVSRGNRVSIMGWAADLTDTTLPEDVLVFHRNQLLHFGTMRGLARWDLLAVALASGASPSYKMKVLLNSGFQFETVGPSSADIKASDIRVFAVSLKGKASELKEELFTNSIVSPATYRLIRSKTGREILQARSGKRSSIDPGGMEGWIDFFAKSGDTLQIGGWAAETKRGQAARAILLFAGDTGICQISTGVTRIDIAKSYQSQTVVSSGFYCALKLSALGLSDRLERLRFFALSGDDRKATEIYRPQDRASKASVGRFRLSSNTKMTDGFLTSTGGDTIRILRDRIDGAIDVLDTIRGEVHIAGWVADLKGKQSIESVLIFLKDKNLMQITTGVPRPDLARGRAREYLRYSGFDYKFPTSLLGGLADLSAVRVFGFSETEKKVTEIVSNIAQRESRQAPPLQAIETAAVRRYVLRKGSSGRETLLSPDGSETTVIPDSVEGHVDVVEIRDSLVGARGWAADVEHARRAKSVIVLAGDVNSISVPTGAFRADLAALFGPGDLDRAGFDCHFPVRFLGKLSDSTAVRFFAVDADGRVASELMYPANYPFKH